MNATVENIHPTRGDQLEPASPLLDAKRLLVLALPSIAFALSRLVLGQMDFVMLTWTGTDATAAISPAVFFVFLIQSLGMGVATSVQTYSAQSMGRGRREQAAAYAWQAIYIGLAFIPLTFPMVRLVRPFWLWVGHAPAVREMEIAFCEISFWAMPFSVICAGLDGYFNGIQKPRVTLTSILAAVLVNGFWNYVLIFGKLGFPAIGIRGSAIATLVAWGVRAAMLFGVFLSRPFGLEFDTRRAWRFDRTRLLGMLRIGGPTGLQWMLDIGSWFVFTTCLIGPLGEATLAASNVAVQYTYYSFLPAIGIGIAVATKVGHAVGQGRPDLARRYTRVGMLMAGGYMAATGVAIFAARTSLMGLLSVDPEVIRIGAKMMIWVAVFQVFDAMQIIYTNALRGAGDTRWPAVAVALHCWVIFVGGGWLMTRFAPSWSYHGPWMTGTLYLAMLGILLWRRFEAGRWERIRLFTESRPAESDAATSSAAAASA